MVLYWFCLASLGLRGVLWRIPGLDCYGLSGLHSWLGCDHCDLLVRALVHLQVLDLARFLAQGARRAADRRAVIVTDVTLNVVLRADLDS